MKEHDIRKMVREGYAGIATAGGSCCGPSSSCCGDGSQIQTIGRKIGYSDEDMSDVPEGANLGLGCGNPIALASLKEGETVVDLGAGAGFDCFLAAKIVGKTGKVIGVDMTPEMIEKARLNAKNGDYSQVEFRLGEIEHLPVADNTADVIISNCVINLSPEKPMVFREAYRILKPGGRLMVSDIVLNRPLPDSVRNSVAAYIGCLAGASIKEEYLDAIRTAGFREVDIQDETLYPVEYILHDPTARAAMKELDISPEQLVKEGSPVVSLKVSAVKP
jgi:ubiquinone/menaquinone biosynthesis C-methylase UbiE